MKSKLMSVAFVASLFLTLSSGFAKTESGKETTLWDRWYTVTISEKVPYAYYNERAAKKDGRIFVKISMWKKEEDFINQEQMGVFAKDDGALTPLFFNFYSTYRSNETKIDGTVTDGTNLSVKVTRGSHERPVIKKSFRKGSIFTSMFPLWIGKKIGQLKINQTYSFQTILEDDIDGQFGSVFGKITAVAPDAYAKKTKTHKLDIRYQDKDVTWWVNDDGSAQKIEMPHRKTVVNFVEKETAENFLK